MEVVNTVGRRKAAVARVFVKPGKGEITINRKSLEVYFPLDILQFQVKQPLLATNTAENYDITINLGTFQSCLYNRKPTSPATFRSIEGSGTTQS